MVGEFARRPPTYRSECLFNKNLPSCEFVHFQNWGAALFTVFVKGAVFLPITLRARRKDEPELAGGNSEWRLRKPAPLNSARVRTQAQEHAKAGPPASG